MKAWTIAAAAAGLMSLSLITPASADSRDHWRGDNWRGSSYSRQDDCDHDRRFSRHHRRDNDGWRRGGERRYSWNDGRWGNDWRDGDRHRGNRHHRDRDHDRRDRDHDWR